MTNQEKINQEHAQALENIIKITKQTVKQEIEK